MATTTAIISPYNTVTLFKIELLGVEGTSYLLKARDLNLFQLLLLRSFHNENSSNAFPTGASVSGASGIFLLQKIAAKIYKVR